MKVSHYNVAWEFFFSKNHTTKVEDYQNMLNLRCWPQAFTSYKTFLTNKKRSGTSLPVSFYVLSFKKKNSHVILTNQILSSDWIAFTFWDIE